MSVEEKEAGARVAVMARRVHPFSRARTCAAVAAAAAAAVER